MQVQQALDALRVIGNEAVHPGELDLRDDVDTASGLFELINVVVEDRITRPKRVAEMFAKLPAGSSRGSRSATRALLSQEFSGRGTLDGPEGGGPAAMIHVFIDTNIYLNFFQFTNDELNKLDKLRVAIDESHLRL